MKKTGAILIGAGAISDTHIQACKSLSEQVELLAIANRHTEAAEKKAALYGLDAQIVSDYRQMLGRQDIEMVCICTPPSTHCGIAIECLNAGKHVLIEKPLAVSVEECDKILEAAKRNGKLVSVIAQSRFHGDAMRAKKLLDNEACGRLLYAEADSVWWRDNCYYDLDWRGRWETEGGGCTLNHAVHHIDMLLWMAGRPRAVTAIMANQNHPNCEEEDIAMALIEFENGAVGRLTSSLLHHGQKQRMVFETQYAEITLPLGIECAKALPNGFPEKDEERWQALNEKLCSVPEPEWTGHTGQWANMLAAIRGDEQLVVSGQDGRNAIELIDGIYESAAQGKRLVFPMTAANSFYTRDGVIAGAPRFSKKTTDKASLGEGRMILANDSYKK